MSIIVWIDPMPKPRMTRSDAWKKRPCVLAYWAWKKELLLKLGRKTFFQDGLLHVKFFISIPTSWSIKKQQAMRGQPHQQKPDLDNLVKALQDALCVSDAHIYEIHAKKLWADQGSIEFFSG